MPRLNQKILRIDPRIKKGYYSDTYFNRTKDILEKDEYYPTLKMQVFQRNNDTCLCGIDEAIGIIRESLGDKFDQLKIMALHDGDIVNAWETVMTIEGNYALFAHLETVYLGALARGTKVATNVYRCVKEARGKPILFFPARFDTYLVQAKDGYSYNIGRGATKGGGVSTDAQGEWWGSKGLGTIPHALIAAYDGNTVRAALKFAEHTDPEVKRIVLVDYNNDCVNTTLAVADAFFTRYLKTKDKRYELFAVRLDTSGTMVDSSVRKDMDMNEYLGSFKPTGVNPQLVRNVAYALKARVSGNGALWMNPCNENKLMLEMLSIMPDTDTYALARNFFFNIGIVVSGGFTPKKIKEFESLNLPVAAYGVGSSLFSGNFDFTADIVQKLVNGKWVHNAKKGRKYNENPRLTQVV